MIIQPSEYLKNCLKIRLDKDISVVIDVLKNVSV